jgi:SAM-dependent methyltransferase
MSEGPFAVAHGALQPSAWMKRFAHLVPRGARLLDLACGTGRHARYFAASGCRVVAVDRDPVALATMAGVAGIETRTIDLETGHWPLAGERFNAVVVANYLHRPLLAPLLATLSDDGVLLYETFARGNEAFGRPASPDFLLERDELLRLVGDRLVVIAFEQGRIASDGRAAVVQRLAAAGNSRTWPPALDPG